MPLNKVSLDQPLAKFPAGTFNTLVDAELKRRGGGSAQPSASASASASKSLITGAAAPVLLLWDGADFLNPGSTVVLGEVMQTPENDPSVPYSGLRFRCRLATGSDDLDKVAFAIAQSPIEPGGIGPGMIPHACWAQVTVNSSSHTTAKLQSETAVLVSDSEGRLPIIWKPETTGLQWCVVQLAARGLGGSGAIAIFVWTDCVELGESEGDDFKIANPWNYTAPTEEDPAVWELNGLWEVDQGDLEIFKILDEDDTPSLITVQDRFFKLPQVSDDCYITFGHGETVGKLIERRCVGAPTEE